MEGQMDTITNQKIDPDRPVLDREFDLEPCADATGYWFAAAAVFAFLAAGIIVYRAGGDEIRTAANDLPTAAQSSPIPSPAPQTR
jgi:hypothetical protein